MPPPLKLRGPHFPELLERHFERSLRVAWRALRAGGGRRVSGGPQGGAAPLLSKERASERPLDEEKRCSSFRRFFFFSLREHQVSLEPRADNGERFQPARGGPGEGMGRSGRTCAVVAVAG